MSQEKEQAQGAEASCLKEDEIGRAIRMVCERNIGVLDREFLSQPVSALTLRVPLCVGVNETLEAVMPKLSKRNISAVLVLDEQGKLAGIFTERDCVRKALDTYASDKKRPVRDFMTPDPITATPDISIAYALNLMSHGGFRHVPLVDQDNLAVGIISIRDVMHHIVTTLVDDLMNFPTFEV